MRTILQWEVALITENNVNGYYDEDDCGAHSGGRSSLGCIFNIIFW